VFNASSYRLHDSDRGSAGYRFRRADGHGSGEPESPGSACDPDADSRSAPEPAFPELRRAAYRCLRQPVVLEDALLPMVRETIADHRSEFERLIHGFRRWGAYFQAPVEETVDGVIRGLQLALEFHDHSVERRPRRVVAMASEIARACGTLDEDVDMEDIYYAVALSNIGKIGMPSTVLAKQQLLNEQDWAELRRHPECAWRILREIPQLRGDADLLYAVHAQ